MSDSPYSPPKSTPSAGAPLELDGSVPNAKRLLWAGFAAILAAGVGFAIRGGILDKWQREFGFTGLQTRNHRRRGLHWFLLRNHHWRLHR